MIVEVRPIETKKWHGKKGEENFSRPLILQCLYDRNTGKYATGLSEADRKRLEKKTGYDLSDEYNNEKAHPFWDTNAAKIKLPYSTSIFDTEKPLDELKVMVLKASRYVANSVSDYENGLYPDATHVIYDESEQMKIKASKIQLRNKALGLSLKMTQAKKVEVIMIMRKKLLKGQSQNYVDVIIDELITEDPERFIMFAKMDEQERFIRSLVLEGLMKNVLTKEGSSIYYLGDKLGNDIDGAVKYFLDPNNQELKGAILEKLTV